MEAISSDITDLLKAWSGGDGAALDKLAERVYPELRLMPRRYLQNEGSDNTLQATAVVHEVYLRLVEVNKIEWRQRAQFFAMAAQMMRRILVDHTRERCAEKRGGGQFHLSLSHADLFARAPEIGLLTLDEALHTLAAIKPQHCRIVELRYFGGLTIAETAEVLGVSHATVERDWQFARAWLRRELSQ